MTTETTQGNNVVNAFHEQANETHDFLENIADRFIKLLPYLIAAAIVLVIGLLLIKLLSMIIGKTMKRSNVNDAARSFLISVIKIILYMILAAMVLSIMHVPASSIVTIFGAAGLAISLALQNCLANLAGGFIILFSKPFSAGDIININDTEGTVRSVSILYTQLETFDGKTVFIPNGKVADAKIVNYTETPERRIDLNFNVSYDTDFRTVQELILGYLRGNEKVLKTPEPMVRMASHKDSSLAIDVLVWVKNPDFLGTRYTLVEDIKELFDKNGIEIPYNQLDVHIKNDREEK